MVEGVKGQMVRVGRQFQSVRRWADFEAEQVLGFVEEIVHEGLALSFGHCVPIESAFGCESAHIVLPFRRLLLELLVLRGSGEAEKPVAKSFQIAPRQLLDGAFNF
jgi:hypothetical protein